MNDTQQEKLKRFLADQLMASTVKEFLQQHFLKPRAQTDVQVLAASRLAIDFLTEAWNDLETYRPPAKLNNERINVGL